MEPPLAVTEPDARTMGHSSFEAILLFVLLLPVPTCFAQKPARPLEVHDYV